MRASCWFSSIRSLTLDPGISSAWQTILSLTQVSFSSLLAILMMRTAKSISLSSSSPASTSVSFKLYFFVNSMQFLALYSGKLMISESFQIPASGYSAVLRSSSDRTRICSGVGRVTSVNSSSWLEDQRIRFWTSVARSLSKF